MLLQYITTLFSMLAICTTIFYRVYHIIKLFDMALWVNWDYLQSKDRILLFPPPFFFFPFSLWPHLWHMVAPRPQPQHIGSKLHLQTMPQPGAMPNLQPTEWGQEWNPHPHGYYVRFLTCWAVLGTLVPWFWSTLHGPWYTIDSRMHTCWVTTKQADIWLMGGQ